MYETDLHQPDLGPLRAAAEGADTPSRTAIRSRRLRVTSPVRWSREASACTIARGMTRDTGSAGLCLLPIPSKSGTGRSGIAVSWTTHNLLLCDWDRYSTYREIQQIMNAALGGVLRAFGYPVAQFGCGGAWLVTGHPRQETGALR